MNEGEILHAFSGEPQTDGRSLREGVAALMRAAWNLENTASLSPHTLIWMVVSTTKGVER